VINMIYSIDQIQERIIPVAKKYGLLVTNAKARKTTEIIRFRAFNNPDFPG